MADPFDSAWLKWGWAVVHAQALDKEIVGQMEEFKTRQPFISRTEYDAKRHCVILRIESVEPLSSRLGLRVGDVANNFRACLDHVAWRLVQRGTAWPLPKKRRGGVYFPVGFDRDDFDDKVKSGLPGLTRTDKALIRRYQPYIHGKRKMVLHCLTPLPRLTADDKHRDIRPTWVFPIGGELRYGEPVDCTITKIPTRARGVVFQPGAELQRIYVRKTGPNPDVYMEATLSVNPTLDGRVALGEWLAKTASHTRELLLEFAPPPEEITTLGIVPDPNALSTEGAVSL